MRMLLDTHVLLWSLAEEDRLDPETRALIEDPVNDVLFSAASIWEIAIKAQLARIDFPVRPERVAQAAREIGFRELPVRSEAAAHVASLPLLHRDPFDRLLVAQAITDPARLYTADALLPRYSESVVLIGRNSPQ